MFDTIFHRWLRVPYTLHIHVDRHPKRPRATVIFLHGLGTSAETWGKVVGRLPEDVRVIAIDLLGFGRSPRPSWKTYDTQLQAKSVITTFLKLRIRGRVTIVGHSMGSLVAVQITKQYPWLVRSLVLCSPPFYETDAQTRRLIPSIDKILIDLYRALQKYPDQLVRLSRIAARYGIIQRSFVLSKDDTPIYLNALEAAIVNQTSLRDAVELKIPIQIIYGSLDPVVVPKNIRKVAKNGYDVTLKRLVCGHDVRGPMISACVKATTSALEVSKEKYRRDNRLKRSSNV